MQRLTCPDRTRARRPLRAFCSELALAFAVIKLQHIAHLEVIEAVQGDAALVARLYLADIFLEALQVGDAARPDIFRAAAKVNLITPAHQSVCDERAGNIAHAADTDYLPYLRVAVDDLDKDGIEHPL